MSIQGLTSEGVWEAKVAVTAVGDGTISATELWLVPGQTATVTATPGDGKFVVWSGSVTAIQSEGLDVFANKIVVKVDAPVTLEATFADLAEAKPADFSADGVTGVFADRQLTIAVETGKTCTYDYSSALASGWVTNVVKTGAGAITPAVASAYMGSFDFQTGAVTLNAAGQLGADNVGIVRKASGATVTSSLTVAMGKKMYLAGTIKHNSWNTFVSSCDIVLAGNLTVASSGYWKDVVLANGSRLDMNGFNLTLNTDQMLIAKLHGMTVTNGNDGAASAISVNNNAKLVLSGGTSFWGGSRNHLYSSQDYANQGLSYSGEVGGDWTIHSRGSYLYTDASSTNTLKNKFSCTVDFWYQYDWSPTKVNSSANSCLTFGGPLTGSKNMGILGGTLNFLSSANTYSGAMTLTDTQSSNFRSGIYVWNGANFSAKSVTLKNADFWMDDNTAFVIPALTQENGTKDANCCTISGGPTGDKACGRATIAGITKSGGKTLTVDSPVHVTGTTLISTNTLALGSGTTADELPVFDHLSFAEDTVFDMNGKSLSIGNLTGIPVVANPGTLTIAGTWTVDGDALADGATLDLGAGRLVFGDGAKIAIVRGTKTLPGKVTIATAAGGIAGTPVYASGSVKRKFSVSANGTKMNASAGGMMVIVR